MKKAIFILIAAGIGLLQASLLSPFKIFGAGCDLLLICLVLSSICSYDPREGLFLGFVIGFFKDILAATPFGINTLLFPLWGYLLVKLSRRISIEENKLIPVALVFVVGICHHILTRLIFLFLGNFIPGVVFLRITMLESLYAAAVIPIAYRLLRPYLNF